ncbi:hypothetical protein OG909_03335 [Streptomyces sp. NBC_01754]|nr:hypothetical protein [Streptomyces sp. NBC_01754]WSC91408.1 hypothetical protein OG909_03335 [Streptomyces sp. NBC_01754]
MQLPKHHRRGRSTLIRTESAGGTPESLARLTQEGRWLPCSVGMTVTELGDVPKDWPMECG